MAVTNKALQPGAAVSDGATTLYLCPANTRAVVTLASFANTDSATRTLTLRCARAISGQNTVILPSQVIAPAFAYIAPVLAGLALGPGDSIVGEADAPSVVFTVISGYEIS